MYPLSDRFSPPGQTAALDFRVTQTQTQQTIDAAEEAGLRYYDDGRPGFTRRRRGGGFTYFDQQGRRIEEPSVLQRIRGLAIPPAWRDVWICPTATGHLQATGRDTKGRKVYRYHHRWRTLRDQTKYDRLASFAHCLPAIRERVEQDLRKRQPTRERIIAIVVELLQKTSIRIGNDSYARDNSHFGLTTLRRRHVSVDGPQITFEFTGKSGQARRVNVCDPRLARALDKCCELPGYELFKYLDEDGNRHRIDSADVNEYLRETTGQDFTARHFRTWAGTVIAAVVLGEAEPYFDQRECEKNIVETVKVTAGELGNTPATCRKFYIHPLIFEAYRDGSLVPTMREAIARIRNPQRHRLQPQEAAVLALLDGTGG